MRGFKQKNEIYSYVRFSFIKVYLYVFIRYFSNWKNEIDEWILKNRPIDQSTGKFRRKIPELTSKGKFFTSILQELR